MEPFCSDKERQKQFPRLKGKAAEAKDLLAAIRYVWDTYAREAENFALIAEMMDNLLETQNILDDHRTDLILPLDKAKQIFKSTKTFLLHYQKLAFEAEARGECCWNMPSKFHWLYHWADRTKFLNPRMTNTFLDEDFVGHWKTLVHSCSAGTELHLMGAKAALKYRWAQSFMGLRTE